MKFIQIDAAEGSELLINPAFVRDVQIDTANMEGYFPVCIRWSDGDISSFVVDDDGYGQVRGLLRLEVGNQSEARGGEHHVEER